MSNWSKFSPITEKPQLVPIDFGEYGHHEDGVASVTCVVKKGTKPLTITWRFNGVLIVNDDTRKIFKAGRRTSILTVEPLRGFHSGIYACEARNSAGSASVESELIVEGIEDGFLLKIML